MFEGGMLQSLFEINSDIKDHTILDFKQYGIQWAYFEAWQKHERIKHAKAKAWELIVKGGTFLAYLLSVIKLIEIFKT
jgi:hypothetical protein